MTNKLVFNKNDEAKLTIDAQESVPVKPITFNSDNQKKRMDEITEHLENGIKDLFESDRYKEYLNTLSKFHNYSARNTLLIFLQKPDASLVAGYHSWKNNFERIVKKGEKGIKIIAPYSYKTKKKVKKIDSDTQNHTFEEVEITVPSFRVVTVFDISQTTGKDLPINLVENLDSNVEKYNDFFNCLKDLSPVPIEFEKIDGDTNGYYHLKDKRIAINEGMSELQTIKTLIHEIAHTKLHDIDLNLPKIELTNQPDRNTKEVQAESIAYVICQYYGLDTSDYSFGYVATWSKNRDLKELKNSIETIRNTSSEIIDYINNNLERI